MRGYLVRVGVDQAFGRWNGPMNPESNEFVYVPIPERRPMRTELATPYAAIKPALAGFEAKHAAALPRHVRLPVHMWPANMHLDPDFEQLTYGDSGTRRGKGLTALATGDIVVFYSGLRPVAACDHTLVYAIVGFYEVAESVRAGSVPTCRWRENAHTRCVELETSDVVVRGTPGLSGRLKFCIPIGEYRTRAYRVRQDVLSAWGGLSCRNGYLQRSAVLPTLLDPPRFMRWFRRQQPEFVTANNP